MSYIGADVNALRYDKRTPLHFACLFDRYDVVDSLLYHGAHMNEKDDDGDTPLHLACKLNKITCVRILLDYDVEINIKNNNGETPYDLCHDDMIEKMIEAIISKQC
jgi:ankyrin repeat protein